MSGAETVDERWGASRPELDTIDRDVHAVVPPVETLFPYLSDHWREYVTQSGFKGPIDTPYPRYPGMTGSSA